MNTPPPGSGSSAPLTVLCITGWCRNGSTIIGNVLNEVPGVFHVGELHFLWKNSVGRGANSLCGCGKNLTDCEIWQRVLAAGRPEGMAPDVHADTVIGRQLACVRTRHTWRVLRRGLDGADIRAHAELMTRTYHEIADAVGARIIVDTTKIPGEAALLPHLEGIETYFVQLVRDPRAVAQSWSREKEYVYAMSASKSTAYWNGFNAACEAILRRYPERSTFLRHEDFIADPAAGIDKLLRLCGADPAANPVQDRTVELHTNHTVTGNPDRFSTGRTVLRERDDAWRTRLPAPARLAAATLSWPRFRRYGYEYRGASSQDATQPGRSPETAEAEPRKPA